MKNADGSFTPRTYKELFEEVQKCAAGLKQIGIKRGDHVGLISENRPEWLVTDFAALSIGAIDVPRGNDIAKVRQRPEVGRGRQGLLP